jgi:hypothetical protein
MPVPFVTMQAYPEEIESEWLFLNHRLTVLTGRLRAVEDGRLLLPPALCRQLVTEWAQLVEAVDLGLPAWHEVLR